MKQTILIVFLIITVETLAQPVTFDWGHRMGVGTEVCGIASVTNAAGDVFTVGTFSGAPNFSATGTLVCTSAGKKDIFITCTGPSGTVVWAKSAGGPGDDIPTSICLVGTNLYITGKFEQTATFGTITITSLGQSDGFYGGTSTSSGTTIESAKSIGGAGDDVINSIIPVGTSKLCMTGSFEGFVDMDASLAGSFTVLSEGAHDVFVEEVNLSLGFLWAKTFGGTGEDYGRCVAADATGNLYLTGSFEGTADMDPGILINNVVSFGASDIFVEKLDASGNFLWANNTGDINADEGRFIKTDAAGNVLVYGDFHDAPDFDPSFTLYTLSSNGGSDIFMQKLDSLGNFLGAFSQGGTLDDHGTAFALDASNNVYCTGTFQNSVDFDPSGGIVTLFSAGLEDMFVQKLDPSFNLIFANSIQGQGSGTSNYITVHSSGNIFTTGNISDTTDFDPTSGLSNLYSPGFSKYYINKWNNSGAYQWVKTNTADPDYSLLQVWDVAADNYGNSYAAGVFLGAVDFDPGPGTFSIESHAREPFIQKIGPSGNLLWAVSFKASLPHCCTGADAYYITTDSVGSVYVLGGISDNTIDFDPGLGTNYASITGTTAEFFVKLDSSGNLIWVHVFSGGLGAAYQPYGGIIFDRGGNLFFSGGAPAGTDMDPGPGVYSLPTGGNFVCKLDPNGNFSWAKQIPSINSIELTVDRLGNPIVSGHNPAFSPVDVDPGPAVLNIGGKGLYIIKLNAFGDFVWADYIESDASTHCFSFGLATDDQNNLFCSGHFSGTVDFDPGAPTLNMTSVGSGSGNSDVFALKFDPTGNLIWGKRFGGTTYESAYDVDVDKFGNVYIVGVYSGTVDFDPGAGTHFYNGYQDTFIEKLDSDGNFVWLQSTDHPGTVGPSFYEPAVDLDPNGNIIVGGFMTKLGDLDPTSGVYNVEATGAQDGFVLKLNQCFVNSTQAQNACNDFTYNGVTYTTTGFYGQVLGTSYTGCDSTITLDITIDGPDNTVTQTGNTLTATQSGASYQWINCTTGLAIAGATLQSYSVTSSGSYAVEINLSGCVDSSACTAVIYTGINSPGQPISNVYPSPFENELTIEYNDYKNQPIDVEITNLLGQIIFKQELVSDTKHQITLNEVQSGMYIVKIYSEDSISQKYIIRK